MATHSRSSKYDRMDRSVFPSWKAKLRAHLTLGAQKCSRFYRAGCARIRLATTTLSITYIPYSGIRPTPTSPLPRNKRRRPELAEHYDGKLIDDDAGDGREAYLALVNKTGAVVGGLLPFHYRVEATRASPSVPPSRLGSNKHVLIECD